MIDPQRKLSKKRFIHVTIFATLSLCGDLEAQISLDATLGKASSLQPTVKAGGAQECLIYSGLGQKVGQNLFHSFSDFKVATGQFGAASRNAVFGTPKNEVEFECGVFFNPDESYKIQLPLGKGDGT